MANLATINNNILADSGIDPLSLIVGTGTVNYVPKFSAEDTIANSQIFDNGTNIGINTAIPLSILDIVHPSIPTAGNYNGIRITDGTIDSWFANWNVGGTRTLRVGTGTSNPIQFYTGGANVAMHITTGSLIGIGTQAPTALVTIIGGGATPSAAGTGELLQLKRATTNNNNNAITAINLANNSNGFTIGYGGSSDRLRFIDGGNIEVVSMFNGGSVAIGNTTNAGYKLDVNGTGNFSGALTGTSATFSGQGRFGNVGLTDYTYWYYFDAFGGSNFMGMGGTNNLFFYVGGSLRLTLEGVSGNATFSNGITANDIIQARFAGSATTTKTLLSLTTDNAQPASTLGYDILFYFRNTTGYSSSVIRGIDYGYSTTYRTGLSFLTTNNGAGTPSEKMSINQSGAIRFNSYGSGTITGTRAYDLAVDSSGNIIEVAVGAGTVTGSGSSAQVAYWSSASSISGENNLWWDFTNNRLGINNNGPSFALDVTGDIETNTFRVYGTNATAGPGIRIQYGGTGGKSWNLISNGTGNADGLGMLQFWNNTDSFTAMTLGYSGGIRTNLYTPLYVSGNVSIGTNNATKQLTIYNSSSARLNFNTSTTGEGAAEGTEVGIFATTNHAFIWNYENADFYIGTNNSEKFRVYSAGNVLINAAAGSVHKAIELTLAGGDTTALKVGYGRYGSHSNSLADIINNAWWDGSVWSSDDAGIASLLYRGAVDTTVGSSYWVWYSSAPATNPNFVQRMFLSGDGNLSVQGSVTGGSIIKSGGTSSQYLMADGSTSTLTNPVTGTGSAGRVTYWSSSSAVTGTDNLFYDATNVRLGIGTPAPTVALTIMGTGATPYAAGTGELLQLKRNTTNGNNNAMTAMNICNNTNGFTIAYGGTTDRLRFIDGGSTEVVSMVNGGNVGINNTGPSYKLDITGDVDTNTFRVYGANATAGPGIRIQYGGTNGRSWNLISNGTNNAGGLGRLQFWNSTDSFTALTIGYLSTDKTFLYTPFELNQTGSTANDNFYVNIGNPTGCTTIFDHTGANGPVPFRIQKSGIPDSVTTTYGILRLTMVNKNVNSGANLFFELTNSADAYTEYAGLGGRIVSATAGAESGDMYFYTMDAGSSRSTKLLLKHNGNFLVGTTTDSGYKLDVNGTARISNNLTMSNGSSIFINNSTNTNFATIAPWSDVTNGGGLQISTGGVVNAISLKNNGRLIINGTTDASIATIYPASGMSDTLTWRTTGNTAAGTVYAYSDVNGPSGGIAHNMSLTSGGAANRFNGSFSAWNISFDCRPATDRMTFNYINTSGTYSTAMTILPSGNVEIKGWLGFSTWTTGSINKIRGWSGNDDKSIQWNYSNSPAGTLITDNNSILLRANSNDAIYVGSDGYVGINNNGASYRLDVVGDTDANTFRVYGTNANYGPGVTMQYGGTNGRKWSIISNGAGNAGGVGALQFWNATNQVTAMVISPAGNIFMGKDTQSGNAALTVKSQAGGNTGIIMIEGDTANNGWGMYATTADKYILTRFTNGSYADYFAITSTGNIGIGTDNPTTGTGGRGLHIYNATTGAGLKISVGANDTELQVGSTGEAYLFTNNSKFLALNSSGGGNVGIGTATDSGYKLNVGGSFYVNGSGSTSQVFYVDAGNSGSTQTIFEHTGSSTPVPFRIMKSGYSGAGSTFGIVEISMNDNTVGNGANLYFELKDSAGNFTEYAGLGGRIVSATNGSEQGDLYFYTMDNGSGRSEKMRIRHDGEVWVGYTSDQGAYKLQVNGSVLASSFFEASDIRLKTILNRHQSVDFDAIEYKWNDGRDSKLHWGYAAQEVMKWLPDAVSGSEENYYTLDYNQVHTYKIAMLEKRIAELEQQLKNK